ncbi:hypothetical protein FisN_19Lh198 [Fistulifera solaris]|uniref:Uncharacterized protein n=1 Tax=Fistulifera solaris TaxID=1519565 RepID=A0A1Z5J7D5_FISSO|nr:hypothetical protein FisN_19Lh198 [Fistulifera solaris]|eukprot:GAX09728.1 hypothetical protein FisN_19Lh198 [Fistulifera solaris]
MPWFWRKAEEDEDDYSSEYGSEEYSSEEVDSEEDLSPNEAPPKENEHLSAEPEDIAKNIEKEEIQETENPPSREDEANLENDENGLEDQLECVPIEFVKTAKSSARARLDSGLTFGEEEDRDKNEYQLPDSDSDDDSEPSQGNNNTQKTESERQHAKENGSEDEEEEEEEEDVTSTAEKLSLLSLAAEHDRVDILNSILAEEKNGPTTLLDGNDNSTIPPLHIAVSYGSVNATNCLLRMGADPSIRPNVTVIQEKTRQMEKSTSHLNRYDDASAWELVFGRDTSASNEATHENHRRTKIEPLDIPLSKREGIRHAFTAEALRCIGSDEVDRLRQLLASGMPHQIDIGGKHLYDWSVEMGALKCEELLRPTQLHVSNGAATNGNGPKKSVVLNRGEPQSISSLLNRLDESHALSNALSSCLDNLGEEVAVCSGLLLLGSGASALASHVRSLRSTLESKQDELDRLQEAWVNSEDELEYWVKKCGPEGEKIASQVFVQNKGPPESNEDEEHQRQQLIGQIAASESKIRMLRVSIADLSEENARNLSEVEKRGLSGGINLVRGLREQIKDLDFKISLAKSGDAECCTKISLLQSKFHSVSQNPDKGSLTLSKKESVELSSTTAEAQLTGETVESQSTDTDNGKAEEDSSIAVTSEQISTGQSTALVLRPPGDRGFFPLSLWTILMRIIGLGDQQIRRQNSRSTPAVII